MDTQRYYNQLRDVFLLPGKSNIDKAKSFRSILEDFFKKSANETEYIPLKKSITNFFFAHRGYPYDIRKAAYDYVDILNNIVHESIFQLTKQELRQLFAQAVGLIFIAFDEKPSDAIQSLTNGEPDLSGLTDQQQDAVLDSSKSYT